MTATFPPNRTIPFTFKDLDPEGLEMGKFGDFYIRHSNFPRYNEHLWRKRAIRIDWLIENYFLKPSIHPYLDHY